MRRNSLRVQKPLGCGLTTRVGTVVNARQPPTGSGRAAFDAHRAAGLEVPGTLDTDR